MTKTVIFIDVDNTSTQVIQSMSDFVGKDVTVMAVGLGPQNLNRAKGSTQCSNLRKFEILVRICQKSHVELNIVTVPNLGKESADLTLSKLMGRVVLRRQYDRALVVSNDKTLIALAVMMNQIIPTWSVQREDLTGELRSVMKKMQAVPTIVLKTVQESPIDYSLFQKEIKDL